MWAHLPCMYDNEWLSQQNKPRAAGESKDQRLKWTSRSREIPHPRRVSSMLFWYLFKTEVSICNNRVRQHSLPQAMCFRFIECLWEREEINMFAAVRALSSLWLTQDKKKKHNTSLAHCYLIIQKRIYFFLGNELCRGVRNAQTAILNILHWAKLLPLKGFSIVQILQLTNLHPSDGLCMLTWCTRWNLS